MRTVRYTLITLLLGSGVGLVAYVLLKSSASAGSGGDTSSNPFRVVLFGPPSPSRDLGVVPPGARVEVPFVLVNEGTAAVTLGGVTTSCDCLSVSLPSREVGAGESVGGTVVLDLGKEPGFRGGLMLTAEANVAGDPARNAFTIRLDADVR
jgi:hypothetical protein